MLAGRQELSHGQGLEKRMEALALNPISGKLSSTSSLLIRRLVIQAKRRILITKFHLPQHLAILEARDTGLSVLGIKMVAIVADESEFFTKTEITLLVDIVITSPITVEI